MSEKEIPKEGQPHKNENINLSIHDILGGHEVDTNSPQYQQIVQTFSNEENHSASLSNLPPELQGLFNSTDTGATTPNAPIWNRNDPASSPHSGAGTPSATQQPSPAAQSAQATVNNSTSTPISQHDSPSRLSASPLQSSTASAIHKPSPQLNGSQPASQVGSASISAQASPQMNLQSSPINKPSPQIAAQSSPPSIASPKVSVPPSPLARAQLSPAVTGSPSANTPQQAPSPIITQATPQSPQVLTPQIQKSSPQIIAARPVTPASQSPKVTTPQQNTQPMIPQQQQQQQPQQLQPQTPTSASQQASSGAASSMTLLDNLTAQLSPDRKDRFIDLFRQLQNNAVTANQFLAQARMLLDQQQYQQLENLKSKPQQPQRAIQPQQAQIMQSKNIKRPMDSSQVRAEDAQRAMSGIAPQAKRARTTDIPITSSQPLPIYRTNTTPLQQQQQQQFMQQQQQLMQQQQHEAMRQYLMQQQQQKQQPQQLRNQQAQSQQAPQKQQHVQTQLVQQPQLLPQQSPAPQPNVDKPTTVNIPIKVEIEEPPSVTQDFMNTEMLTEIITKITTTTDVKIGSDVVTLIALATQERIQRFIHHMIEASKHRVDSQTFTQPTPDEKGNLPFKIVDVQDIKKQLLAIERVEREVERKRKEVISERERKAQMGDEGNEGGDDDKPAKKKKKKDQGPGVAARHMSDDVRNKTTNETALMIAGGVMKSWMLAGATPIKEKPQPLALSRQNSNTTGLASQDTPAASPSASAGLSNSSPIPAISTASLTSPIPGTPLATSPTNAAFIGDANATTPTAADDQPRGRGRPRRRKSGSGPDIMSGKKSKGFMNRAQDGGGGFFLPPSTIGRPNRLGEQGARRVTVRDALFVLEEEDGNRDAARRTLQKTYATYLK